jgi:hypothetical protein
MLGHNIVMHKMQERAGSWTSTQDGGCDLLTAWSETCSRLLRHVGAYSDHQNKDIRTATAVAIHAGGHKTVVRECYWHETRKSGYHSLTRRFKGPVAQNLRTPGTKT